MSLVPSIRLSLAPVTSSTLKNDPTTNINPLEAGSSTVCPSTYMEIHCAVALSCIGINPECCIISSITSNEPELTLQEASISYTAIFRRPGLSVVSFELRGRVFFSLRINAPFISDKYFPN